jgi:hypothetical protein
MTVRRFGGLWLVGLVVLVAGAAIRVSNAFVYPTVTGFDARANWRYVDRLTESWELPAPDADWSTAHPPLFYYAAAGVRRALGVPDQHDSVLAIRLVGTAFSLAIVALAVLLVRRADPENPGRAWLAGALLLFLPAHIYISAMLHEETWAAAFASLALVGVSLDWMRASPPGRPLLRAALWGLAAGLALLTKLSGLLAVATVAGVYALDGWRRREWRLAAGRIAVVLAVALAVGGWYYARNQVRYGYLYPYGLDVHKLMFEQPPGERRLGDYLRFPLETFTQPSAISPPLLRSVWGTTYASVWFDAHRHFLPSHDAAVDRVGTLLLALALLPTVAFAGGLARGTRRALESGRSPDPPLLLLTGLTLAGYLVFSWRNPWYPVLKGSFLLGLSVPFAFYASEVLVRWRRASKAGAVLVACVLAALFVGVAATFTQGVIFEKWDKPGFQWKGR